MKPILSIYLLSILLIFNSLTAILGQDSINRKIDTAGTERSAKEASTSENSGPSQKLEKKVKPSTLKGEFLFPIRLELSNARLEDVIHEGASLPLAKFIEKDVSDFPTSDDKPVLRIWGGNSHQGHSKVIGEAPIEVASDTTKLRLRFTADNQNGFVAMQVKGKKFTPLIKILPDEVLTMAKNLSIREGGRDEL